MHHYISCCHSLVAMSGFYLAPLPFDCFCSNQLRIYHKFF